MGSKTPQYLIDKCRQLRLECRASLLEIMRVTGLGKTTVHSIVKDIPLSPNERAWIAATSSHTAEATEKRAATWAKKREERGFDESCFDIKRKIIIAEQNGTCAHCGLSEWRGKPICLEIDHKNGIGDDHRRENMEAICPNCHAVTDTWRGRNKKSVKSVSDELLIAALQTSKSIRQALINVGLTPKGGNYERAKKLNETVRSKPLT